MFKNVIGDILRPYRSIVLKIQIWYSTGVLEGESASFPRKKF